MRDALDRYMVQKVTEPIDISALVNNARREAAKIYTAHFAGAPVKGELENAERRLLDVLMYIYRNGRAPVG